MKANNLSSLFKSSVTNFSIKSNTTNNKAVFTWGEDFNADLDEFRKEAIKTVDYIADYHLNISSKNIHNKHDKNFLNNEIPSSAPNKPTSYDEVLKNIDEKIISKSTLYNHPGFMADSNLTSYPAILGNFISDAFNNPGVSWIANPAGFELERIILDFLADEFSLPKNFRKDDSGCCVHLECGESANVSVLAARYKKKIEYEGQASKFVYYYSKENSAILNKAVHIAGGIKREINAIFNKEKQNYEIDVQELIKTIENDKKEGLIPTFVSVSMGNHSTVAVDDIESISSYTSQNKIWCHVDASILGNTLLLKQNSFLLKGLDKANSIVVEGQKGLPVGIDSSFYWVDEAKYVFKALNEDFVLYVQFFKDNQAEMTNYHFGTARATKSLRIWMVIKSYGLNGLRALLQKQIDYAQLIESKLCTNNNNFNSFCKSVFGTVCFRINGFNDTQQKEFVQYVNDNGKLFITCDKIHSLDSNNEFCKLVINDLYIDEKRVDEIVAILNQSYNEFKAQKF